MPPNNQKQGPEPPKATPKHARTAKGSASQPITIEALWPILPIRTSLQKALAIATSQAMDERP
ncbi:hypothetical protein EJ02DRAFT_309918, partial [Clathrospora elynae]